jgi:hypothetical protein
MVVGTMLIVMHLLSTLADTLFFQQPYPTRTEVNHLYFLQPQLLARCSTRNFDQSLCLKQSLENSLRSLTQSLHENGGFPSAEPFRSMAIAFINSINWVSAFLIDCICALVNVLIDFIIAS